jgi:hypothetical protein
MAATSRGGLVADGESQRMPTAQQRLSRLIPHPTACRQLYLSASKANGRPPELPLFFR